LKANANWDVKKYVLKHAHVSGPRLIESTFITFVLRPKIFAGRGGNVVIF